MKRYYIASLAIMLLLSAILTGCSLPGWQATAEEAIAETEPVEEVAELDLSNIFVGSWMGWSAEKESFTGYTYAFYQDGVIFVSRDDLTSIILEGSYEFIGNNTFKIEWKLTGSGIQFEPMTWQVQSIKHDEVHFVINDNQDLILRRVAPDKPAVSQPPADEPPAPPQTPSTEIRPNMSN